MHAHNRAAGRLCSCLRSRGALRSRRRLPFRSSCPRANSHRRLAVPVNQYDRTASEAAVRLFQKCPIRRDSNFQSLSTAAFCEMTPKADCLPPTTICCPARTCCWSIKVCCLHLLVAFALACWNRSGCCPPSQWIG